MPDPRTVGQGRYVVREVLGSGATSVVYLAHDVQGDVDRAVKVLHPRLAAHGLMRARFEREAAMMARLHHPNIVAVHDFGLHDDRFYLVMDLVPGGTLQERMDRLGPLSPRFAVSLVLQLLHALQYAHAQGVVHRDVGPHNVLLDRDGTPRLTDFGIARAIDQDQSLARPGSVMGTWGYMAPEQRLDAKLVDNRTDIYAAGALLHALLTGARPGDLFQLQPGDAAFASVPQPLVPIIQEATRYQPADRYHTAAELARELGRAHARLPSQNPDDEATILEDSPVGDSRVRAWQRDLAPLAPPAALDPRVRRAARQVDAPPSVTRRQLALVVTGVALVVAALTALATWLLALR